MSFDRRYVYTVEGNVGDCMSVERRDYFVNGVLASDIDGIGVLSGQLF